MINFLNSIYLHELSVLNKDLNFNKMNSSGKPMSVTFTLKNELQDLAAEVKDNCKLILSTSISADNEDNQNVFRLELSVEYIFKIKSQEHFYGLPETDRVKHCSSISYLDFRAKILSSLSGLGVEGFTLPLSLESLAEVS